MGLPEGFHIELAHYQPDNGLTFSEDELRQRFNGDTRIRCGYCDGRARSRTLSTLVKWFHGHDCEPAHDHELALVDLDEIHDSLTCCDILKAA